MRGSPALIAALIALGLASCAVAPEIPPPQTSPAPAPEATATSASSPSRASPAPVHDDSATSVIEPTLSPPKETRPSTQTDTSVSGSATQAQKPLPSSALPSQPLPSSAPSSAPLPASTVSAPTAAVAPSVSFFSPAPGGSSAPPASAGPASSPTPTPAPPTPVAIQAERSPESASSQTAASPALALVGARVSPGSEASLPAASARLAAKTPAFSERALASLEWRKFSDVGQLVYWPLPDRDRSALVMLVKDFAQGETKGKAGLAALGLGLLADELSALKLGAIETAIADSGEGGLSISFAGPAPALAMLVPLLPAALASPAFLAADFPEEAFQAALRELRAAARRRELADPLASGSPLGNEAGLRGLGLEDVRRYWRENIEHRRLSFVLVGKLDPGPLAAAFAGLSERAGAPASAPKETTSRSRAGLEAATVFAKASGTIILLREGFFGSVTRGTMATLAEWISLNQGQGLALEWELEGRGLRLSFSDEAGRGGAFELLRASLLRLASTEGKSAVSLGPSESSVELATRAAGLRALSRLFEGEEALGLALAMAEDLSAGGDGSAPFLLAAEIEKTGGPELRAAARALAAMLDAAAPR